MAIQAAKLMHVYDPDRANKIKMCGTYLEFAKAPDGIKLHHANFCRERMCPMCQWRRAIKLRIQADKIYAEEMRRGHQHIFVTLTIRNVPGTELSTAIDKMVDGVNKWRRLGSFKRAFVGSYRAIEVTYNAERNDYHPHIHMMLTCQPDYFDPDNPYYWTHDDVMHTWRDIMGLDYDPMVHIEGIHPKQGQTITAACVELCKYPTKTAQVHSSTAMEYIDRALRGRRLIQWTGLTKKIRAEMDMDEIEEGNLIHTDDATADGVELEKVVYIWRHGYYTPLDWDEIRQGVS